MTEADNQFFEEYKRLDRLCRDVLSATNGVSEYITQMEESGSARFVVPFWDNNYKTLKHLRWVRNQIAHDTSGLTISTDRDLKDVTDFYNRIMEQTDPFAQLRKIQVAKKKKTIPNRAAPPITTPPPTATVSGSNRNARLLKVLAWIICIIFLADIILCLKISHII